MAPWKATNDERRLDNKTEWAANCPWRRANTALYAAMAEYHKAPKQVSNDWTPRLRRGKPQLFARCGWRQLGLAKKARGNPPFPPPLRTNGTARAAPLHVPALLAAVDARDGRRMQPFTVRRKAGRCAPRSAPSRRRGDPHPSPPPYARETITCRRKSPSSRPAASRRA